VVQCLSLNNYFKVTPGSPAARMMIS